MNKECSVELDCNLSDDMHDKLKSLINNTDKTTSMRIDYQDGTSIQCEGKFIGVSSGIYRKIKRGKRYKRFLLEKSPFINFMFYQENIRQSKG